MPAASRRRFTSRISEVLPNRRGASIRMFWPPRNSRSRTSRSVSRSVKASPDTMRPKRKGLVAAVGFTRPGITQVSITSLREVAYKCLPATVSARGSGGHAYTTDDRLRVAGSRAGGLWRLVHRLHHDTDPGGDPLRRHGLRLQ